MSFRIENTIVQDSFNSVEYYNSLYPNTAYTYITSNSTDDTNNTIDIDGGGSLRLNFSSILKNSNFTYYDNFDGNTGYVPIVSG